MSAEIALAEAPVVCLSMSSVIIRMNAGRSNCCLANIDQTPAHGVATD